MTCQPLLNLCVAYPTVYDRVKRTQTCLSADTYVDTVSVDTDTVTDIAKSLLADTDTDTDIAKISRADTDADTDKPKISITDTDAGTVIREFRWADTGNQTSDTYHTNKSYWCL